MEIPIRVSRDFAGKYPDASASATECAMNLRGQQSHSDDDKSVPVQQALDMVQAVEKGKVRHRFIHYKDNGHISITDDVIKETRAFIDEISGKGGE